MQPIVIEISNRITAKGVVIDQARCGDILVEKRAGCVIGELCRQLVEDGVHPATPAHVMRGEVMYFQPMPVGTWAKPTVSKTGRGPKSKPYKETI